MVTIPATKIRFDYQGTQFEMVCDQAAYIGGQWAEAHAFVDGAPDPSMPRPPYGDRGANAENDAAWDRYNAEELRILSELLAAALGAAGVTGVEDVWDRRAGCEVCPCSPGFLLSAPVAVAGITARQVHISRAEDCRL